MSAATSLRSFLMNIDDLQIYQVAQQHIPQSYDLEKGVIWFARRGGSRLRTFEKADGVPEEMFFDVEIYHDDINVVESDSDLIQGQDGHHGEFGDGWAGAFFVDLQGDDYVPQVQFDDDLHLSSVFLSIEVRNYTE